MNTDHNSIISQALYRLLRPLVRILLRQGIPFSSFAAVARRAYIDVAEQEFVLEGRKQSASRISVLTGINRKDIAKAKKEDLVNNNAFESDNRASKVINGWLRDPDFLTPGGKPKKLSLDSGKSNFAQLVRRYSGDVPYKAIFDELDRINAVTTTDSGKIALLANAYVPIDDFREQMRIMSTACDDMLGTIDHNLSCNPEDGLRLQRTVAYNDIPVESLNKIRQLSQEQGMAFLLQVNEWLSNYDRDNNDKLVGSGKARAGIGIYYFQHVVDEENDNYQD